jgi:hypothetical protein
VRKIRSPRPRLNTCWKPGSADDKRALDCHSALDHPQHHHAVVDCSSSAITSWRRLKCTMSLNLPLQAMPSMQTAPVSFHPLRSINSVDPHSTFRGRRQLEHERSSGPLTQWCRLDASGDTLRGNVFMSIILFFLHPSGFSMKRCVAFHTA